MRANSSADTVEVARAGFDKAGASVERRDFQLPFAPRVQGMPASVFALSSSTHVIQRLVLAMIMLRLALLDLPAGALLL